jgi:Zn-dependent M32 family carboxypeptidase
MLLTNWPTSSAWVVGQIAGLVLGEKSTRQRSTRMKKSERQRHERRTQPPVVALAQRLAELAEVDIANRNVRECDRDYGCQQNGAVADAATPAEPAHRACSAATQARL